MSNDFTDVPKVPAALSKPKPPSRSERVRSRLGRCLEISMDFGCTLQEALLADLIESLEDR